MPFSGGFFLPCTICTIVILSFKTEQFLNATPLREKEKHCHITYWIFSLHKTQINKDNFRYHEIVLMKVYTTLLTVFSCVTKFAKLGKCLTILICVSYL